MLYFSRPTPDALSENPIANRGCRNLGNNAGVASPNHASLTSIPAALTSAALAEEYVIAHSGDPCKHPNILDIGPKKEYSAI
jgi:hypothetical protein